MKKIVSRDNSLFEKDVVAAFNEVTSLPIVNGVLLENVVLSATTLKVSHSLNRTYRGYIVVKRSANQTVYTDTADTSDPALFIPLKAGGAVTVSLWVF